MFRTGSAVIFASRQAQLASESAPDTAHMEAIASWRESGKTVTMTQGLTIGLHCLIMKRRKVKCATNLWASLAESGCAVIFPE